jgi:hypothetical protein
MSSYEEWLCENENLTHLSLEAKWQRVVNTIRGRIIPNIAELCSIVKDKKINPHRAALEISDKRLTEAKKYTSVLEVQTKKINAELEQKFRVYTS